MATEGCIGEIRFFAGNFPPRSWAFCNGQLLEISQNQALFSILGTTYGGDGRTTFALPDLRGRMIIHPGNGPGLSSVNLGQQQGAEFVTLTQAQMPSHQHSFSVTANTDQGVTPNPANAVLGNAGMFDNEFHNAPDANNAVEMAGDVTGPAGGNQPFDNRQPSLGINAIICLFGIFPSRN